MNSRKAWALVAGAGILVGTALRFASLDRWCLWPDELASLRRATTLSFGAHLAEMRGNHPFYEVALLRPWSRATQSDGGIRILSALAGSLGLFAAWLLARQLDAGVGAVSVWLLAMSPLHVMFSRLARPYALAALLATCASLALVAAVQRRRGALPAYVALGVLLVLTNLFAAALLVAHAVVLLWLHRRRPRLLLRWAAAGAVILALLAPWLASNLVSALAWSQDTPYRAQQMGAAIKALYVPFTFAVGETVHPLNLWVVLPAVVVFGAAGARGVAAALGRRRGGLLFLVETAVVLGVALFMKAAAPKHMLVVLPGFLAVTGLGVLSFRRRVVQAVLLGAMLLLDVVSLGNYFSGREFHDADMVTPWRRIAGEVQAGERPGDALRIGYRGDRDVWRMFRRYYQGRLRPEYLDFRDWRKDLGDALMSSPTVWVLLHTDDPIPEVESWLRGQGCSWDFTGYQMEEHTLQGLREGIGSAGKYRSYLYRLYRVRRPPPAG